MPILQCDLRRSCIRNSEKMQQMSGRSLCAWGGVTVGAVQSIGDPGVYVLCTCVPVVRTSFSVKCT